MAWGLQPGSWLHLPSPYTHSLSVPVLYVVGSLAYQFGGGPIHLRQSALDALPSMSTGGIIVFVTGELAQGAGVRVLPHFPPTKARMGPRLPQSSIHKDPCVDI